MSLETTKAVFSASERKYTAAVKNVQVAWSGNSRVRKVGTKGLIHGFVKRTQFCVSLFLRGNETGTFKERKAFSF